MKQVWIDIDQHKKLKEMTGKIAGRVRIAIRLYLAIISAVGDRDDLEAFVLGKIGAE